MRRERKNERKVAWEPQSPSNPHKEYADPPMPVVQMATRNARARVFSQRKYIYKIHARPRWRSARAPVNRFPEDVDQFRVERRRGMEERKGERKRALSPSRASVRARENPSSLHPRPLHHRPPFFLFLLLPPSIRRSPPIPRTPSLSLSLSFFLSRRKNAPFGLGVLVASAVSIGEKKKDAVSLCLRALPPSRSHPFFRSRHAKQS